MYTYIAKTLGTLAVIWVKEHDMTSLAARFPCLRVIYEFQLSEKDPMVSM